MVFLCPLWRRALRGAPSSGRIQAADCLFVSGSKVAIHVSSVVITLAKNSPGSILMSARLSSHSCFRKAFCSSVSMWGTMRAQRQRSLRSFFTMFQTVPLDNPLAAESPLTLLLLLALISPWMICALGLVLLLRGHPDFGLSLVASSPALNRFHQTHTWVCDMTASWKTCFKHLQHSMGLKPDLHKNLRFTLCSCFLSGLLTLARKSRRKQNDTPIFTHLRNQSLHLRSLPVASLTYFSDLWDHVCACEIDQTSS